MKIAVIGPGAVGSYYGAKLARDGHELHFLLRSDYEQVRRHGVRVTSPEGNFNVRVKCATTPEEIGVADLVVVALKATANDQFPKLLPPVVGEGTAILTLQNGLGNEEALARLFPADQILGGLCFVCLNRTAPGVVEHLAHGKIELGEFQRWPEPRTHDIATAFRHAGIPASVRDNLEKAHWEKLVWNIPFNGLGVASCAGIEAVMSGQFTESNFECLTTDRLLANPNWLRLIEELMREVIETANAFDMKIPVEYADEQIARTREMGAYKPSTLIDFVASRPIELDALFLEPLRRAESKQASVPRLRALCSILSALDRRIQAKT
jgi:2-dehydropantoate 2-reductase